MMPTAIGEAYVRKENPLPKMFASLLASLFILKILFGTKSNILDRNYFAEQQQLDNIFILNERFQVCQFKALRKIKTGN